MVQHRSRSLCCCQDNHGSKPTWTLLYWKRPYTVPPLTMTHIGHQYYHNTDRVYINQCNLHPFYSVGHVYFYKDLTDSVELHPLSVWFQRMFLLTQTSVYISVLMFRFHLFLDTHTAHRHWNDGSPVWCHGSRVVISPLTNDFTRSWGDGECRRDHNPGSWKHQTASMWFANISSHWLLCLASS